MAIGTVHIPYKEPVVEPGNKFYFGTVTTAATPDEGGNIVTVNLNTSNITLIPNNSLILVYFDVEPGKIKNMTIKSGSNTLLNTVSVKYKQANFNNYIYKVYPPDNTNIDVNNYYIKKGLVYKFIYRLNSDIVSPAGKVIEFVDECIDNQLVQESIFTNSLSNRITITNGSGTSLIRNVGSTPYIKERWMGESDVDVLITPNAIGAASYDAGTWTPKLYIQSNLINIDIKIAKYEKIGRIVHLQTLFEITSDDLEIIGSSISSVNQYFVRGLPFNSVNYAQNNLSLPIGGTISYSSGGNMLSRIEFSCFDTNGVSIIIYKNSALASKIFIDIFYEV